MLLKELDATKQTRVLGGRAGEGTADDRPKKDAEVAANGKPAKSTGLGLGRAILGNHSSDDEVGPREDAGETAEENHLGDGGRHAKQHGANGKPEETTQEDRLPSNTVRQPAPEDEHALCPAEFWHKGSYANGCARPILMAQHHQHQLEELHRALTLAITDVVERWWTDEAARLPQRMPLLKEEEELLQWMEGQVPHNLPEFRNVLGSWRPDFLMTEGPKGGLYPSAETYCLTEINARFSFNGFMHEAYGQQGLLNLGIEERGLSGATDPAKVVRGLCNLFRPDLPLHLLKGAERGIDIHMFVNFLETRLGLRPHIITPEDLRLVPDEDAPMGHRLCCLVPRENFSFDSSPVSSPGSSPASSSAALTGPMSFNGELVEEIHQLGLEVHQWELLSLPMDMLRAISLRCFNDLRTVLLVHDKRMLGIVREELDSMVGRSVLSAAQADILRHGIAETLLPGSPEVLELLQRSREVPALRAEYLLKPIRGGKGAGIIFGDEASAEDWIARLEQLEHAELVPGHPTWVVQRQVKQRLYDVVLGTSGKHTRYPLVGTYHRLLQQRGLLKLSLDFRDDKSNYLRGLVVGLHKFHGHGLPLDHSASQGWFWDVRPSAAEFQSNGCQARSETMQEFPWHTDCSYEENPPRYFALQVLHPDRRGGGVLSVLSVEHILGRLSPFAQATLWRPEFQIAVPPEFVGASGRSHIVGSILRSTGTMRFREDIITPLSPAAAGAVAELKQLLMSPEVQRETLHLDAECMPQGSVLLMDNSRWLHARNQVKEPERHLRRVRWDATPFA
ncbi:Clavaminate synthase [Staphylotrichum tortipilum]|uniref:Clavaminate synthase n=1 Tax=Staphylotrichum tortipilum TaxID=2831512 RepID=A0AAN6MCB0_9PEZI|nr:Clavaminate synthase [Staphylotrichum longicolle]